MGKSALDTPHNSSSQKSLVAALFLALIVRGLVLGIAPDALQNDIDGYRELAETLRETGVYGYGNQGFDPPRQTAFRPPLYPLVLSWLVVNGSVTFFAAAVLHLVLGLATCGLVWWTARRWGFSPGGAFAAASLTACDPLLLQLSTQLMTETLAGCLAAGALALVPLPDRPSPGRALALGCVLGLASLARPTFLPWGLLVAVAMLRTSWPVVLRVRCGLAIAVGAAVILLPWGVRNARVFGQPRVTTTHGGYTYLLGNNPLFYRFLREHSAREVWDSRELDQAWLNRRWLRNAQDDLLRLRHRPADPLNPQIERTEFEDDRLAYDLANRYIREDPWGFARATASRVISFWQVLPRRKGPSSALPNAARYGVGLWYLAIYASCLAGVWRLRERVLQHPWLAGLLLCIAFTAVHTLFWSVMRMRAPLVPFLSLLAVAAWDPSLRRGYVSPKALS